MWEATRREVSKVTAGACIFTGDIGKDWGGKEENEVERVDTTKKLGTLK
ncbi:MAG: hypothetical protein GY696_00690 [Gammaproteobacteria bacterium]|nr:hypothetical protein [Gammaproteobacteria bacterium]